MKNMEIAVKIKEDFFFWFGYACIYFQVYSCFVCVRICKLRAYLGPVEIRKVPGTGVPGVCKLPCEDWDQTQVLWKGTQSS